MKKRISRKERYEALYAASEPFRRAKTETIHTLAGIGRRHRLLRYPIMAALVVYIFIYNLILLILYGCIQLKVKERLARGVALLMTAVLVLTSVDATVFAAIDNAGAGEQGKGVIAAFSRLDESVAVQVLPVGAKESEITFPDTLAVTLKTGSEDKPEGSTTSTEKSTTAPEESTTSTEESTTAPESTKPEETPAAIGDTETEENVPVGNSVSATDKNNLTYLLPQPMVVHAAELNERTSAKPEVLIDVTWKLDVDKSTSGTFDSSKVGNRYVYVPVIPKGYTVAEGVELPQITITIQEIEETAGGKTSASQICGWHFDEENVAPKGDLFYDAGSYSLVVAGGSSEVQIPFADITSIFPESVTVQYADLDGTDGIAETDTKMEEVLPVLGWSCPEYVEDEEGSLPYSGSFFFKAVLGEDGKEKEYAFADGVEQVGVWVVFDAPMLLANATPGTTITSNTTWEAQTLSAGTYTINPGVTVTVSGRLTISGNVTIKGGGKLLRAGSYAGSSNSNGSYSALLYLDSSGDTLTLENITIDGNSMNAYGPAVYISSGEVNMNSGSVIQNNWNMNTETVGTCTGGGIYCTGKLNINGGTIKNCRTEGSVNTTHAYTHAGGGIYLKGTCYMTAGSITGNSASNGGGIYLASTGATLKLTGGTISGNKAKGEGTGIYYSTENDSTSKIYIGGSTNVKDIIYLDNRNGNLYPLITSKINYKVTLKCNSMEEGKILAEGSNYNLTGVDASKIFMENSGLYSRLDTGNNRIVLSKTEEAEAKWQTSSGGTWQTGRFTTALANVYDGGTIELLKDVVLTGQTKISKRVTITSESSASPRTITRLPEGKFGNITLTGSGNLTLTNIIYDGNRAYINETAVTQSLIKIGDKDNLGTSLTLGNGCIIRDGYKTGGSGVIAVYGTMTMNSGAVIENCEVDGTGGAVWVSPSGKFTMNGGTIRSCTAGGGGSAISSDGKCILNGGSITGNTDNSKNCAVYLRAGKSGDLTLNGVTISGNTYSVYNDGMSVSVTGNSILSGSIYTTNAIKASGNGVSGLTKTYSIEMSSVTNGTTVVTGSVDTTHFKLANSGYTLISKSGTTNLIAAGIYTITYNKNSGTIANESNYTSYTYGKGLTLPTPTRTGYTFGGWYKNASSLGSSVTSIGTTDTGNKTYYAKWTRDTYTISYNLDGGTVTGNPGNYTIESNAITLKNPTRTGYTFKGWSGTGLSGDSNKSVTIAKGSTGNRGYTAHWTANTYTIKLNGNGGSGGTSLTSYTYGVGATLPTNWTKTGYTLDGWYNNANLTGTKVTAISGTDIGNKEYWAKWTPNKYTVTFNYQGATGGKTQADKSVTYQSSYSTLPSPTRTGYDFAGWYTAASGGSLVTSNTKVTTAGDHTLHARWTTLTYNITYDLAGGALSTGATNPETYTIERDAITLKNPTKTGYTFKGWNGTGLSGDSNTSVTIAKGSTGDRSYTAHWTANTYTVSYNGNGKTGGSTAGSSHTYDTAKALTTNGFKKSYTVTFNHNYTGGGSTTRTANYTFAGWNTKSDGKGTDYADNASVKNLTTVNNGTVNLYAKWTAASVEYVPTRTGYTFAGWFTDSNCSDSRVDSNGSYTPGNNITLYAKWTADSHTVTYDYGTNGGTSATKTTDNVSYGSSIDLTPTATKSGWEFVGWNTNSAATTKLTSLTMGTSNVTLYAIYKKTLTATFYSGADRKTQTKSVTIYNTATSGSVTAPALTSWSGWTKVGWNSKVTGYTSEKAANAIISISADVNYYGVYSKPITLSYNANEGNGTVASQTGTRYANIHSSITYKNPSFTIAAGTGLSRTGYTFNGWYTSANGGTEKKSNESYVLDKNSTLYAHWAANTYMVSYDGNKNTGGNTADSSHTYDTAKNLTSNGFKRSYKVTFNHNYTGSRNTIKTVDYIFAGWNTRTDGTGDDYADKESVKNLTAVKGGMVNLYAKWTAASVEYVPTRTGYTFGGWFTDSDCSERADSDGSYTPGSDSTLYAHWTANEYTVSYDGNKNTGGNTADSSHTYDTEKTLTPNGFTRKYTVTFDHNYTEGGGTTKTADYIFAGWNTGADGTGDNYADKESVTNLTAVKGGTVNLYAKWTAVSVEYVPTRTGYTFAGWFTSPSGGTRVDSDGSYTPGSDITLYAHWTVDSHTVTYDYSTNGGTSATKMTDNVNYNSEIDLAPTAEKDGWEFVGWNTNKDATTGLDSLTMGTSDVTLYAIYQKTVTATFYSGADKKTQTEKVTIYNTATSGNVTVPALMSWDGWTGVGWNSAEAAYTPEKAEDAIISISADVNYYGVYSKTLTLSYDANGGNGNIESQTGTRYANVHSSVSYNNPSFTIAAGTGLSRTGYTFNGWYTSANGGAEMKSNESYLLGSDSTLYAHWTANEYTVSYKSNRNTEGSMTPSIHKYDTAKNLISNGFKRSYDVIFNHNYTGSSNTTKTADYIFAGWNTRADGTGDNYADKESVKNLTAVKDGTVTLYAKWTETSVEYVPTRTGYTFGGWFTDSDCSDERADSDGSYTPGSNSTLYAHWTANEYTVSYDGNKNTGGNTADSSHTYDTEKTLTPNGFTRSYTVTFDHNYTEGGGTTKTADYIFAGWNTRADGTGDNYADKESVTNLTAVKGETFTLYAKWTETSVEYVPTRTGYTFGGWFTDSDCSGERVDSNGSYTPGRDITLYAKWTDDIAPVIGTLQYSYQPKNLWQWMFGRESLIITVPVTEEGSGADEIMYTETPEGGQPSQKTSTISDGEARITIAADFKGTIVITCTDKDQNTSDSVTAGEELGATGLIIEDHAPEIVCQVDKKEVSAEKYYNAPDIIVMVTDDGNSVIFGGIASVFWTIGDHTEKVEQDFAISMRTSVSFTIPAASIPAGDTDITLKATDNAGNTAVLVQKIGVMTNADKAAAAAKVVEEALAGITVTNDTTKNDIQNVIDNALSKAELTDVSATVESLDKTKATMEEAGSISGSITIISREDESVSILVPVTGTIARLPQDKPDASDGQDAPGASDAQQESTEQSSEQAGQRIPVLLKPDNAVITGELVAAGNVPGMAGTSVGLELGEGTVIVSVVCDEQEYAAGVADTVAVANAVVTPEQIQSVNNGENIEIRVDVKDISQNVQASDQKAIESGMEEYRKEMPNLTLGMYVDISMFIRVGTGSWDAVTSTREQVEVVLGIPEELREEGREFYIVRSHEGEYALLEDMDDVADTVTISTDRFSTYAIAYRQADGTEVHRCGLCHICPTFLGICCFIWLAIFLMAVLAIVWISLRRKQKSE